MNLILASSSKYRAQLLKNAGYNPIIKKPDIDESLIKNKLKNKGPLIIAQTLAHDKAMKVAQLLLKENTIKTPWALIGSDQVCTFKNEIFDKPETFENNFLHLKKLQGSVHSLITCVCLITFNQTNNNDLIKYEFHDQTNLVMKPLSDQQIIDYLNLDKPFDCAGGYRFESHGHTLMTEVITKDETAIQGLPMNETLKYLVDQGLTPTI